MKAALQIDINYDQVLALVRQLPKQEKIKLSEELKKEGIDSLSKIKKPSQSEVVLKPFTKKQLVDRAQKSNEDYVSGRFKTQEELESASDNW